MSGHTIDLGFGVLSTGLFCDRCRGWTKAVLTRNDIAAQVSVCSECDVTDDE